MRIDYPRPEQEQALRKLWKLAFEDTDEDIGSFFSTAYRLDHCRCLMVAEEIAAALYWLDGVFRGQRIAYLYAIATHPSHRNRGLCQMLIEDTHSLLEAEGYAAAMLMPAGKPLREMYRKMGYQDCCTREDLFCTAGEAVPLRQIGTEEYAALRREYLPEGGVIQERENLAYLSAGAALYAGQDFLLAAVPNGESLFGLELLGNRNAAPGILSALGCQEGTFRVPGGEIPTAMLLMLGKEMEIPAYFGLTFD